MGRLGLRRGELTHLRADWIDERNQMLSIPRQQDCAIGKGDADCCGYCRQLAEQRIEFNPELSMATAVDMQWAAKTDAAARDVYFGFSPRAELYIQRFTDRYDRWPVSSTGVNRRVKDAAEAADRLERADVRPHALRATAATRLAAEGLEMHALMQYFGWAKPQTAEVYLSRNGKNTARQLDTIQSR
jgi:integrase